MIQKKNHLNIITASNDLQKVLININLQLHKMLLSYILSSGNTPKWIKLKLFEDSPQQILSEELLCGQWRCLQCYYVEIMRDNTTTQHFYKLSQKVTLPSFWLMYFNKNNDQLLAAKTLYLVSTLFILMLSSLSQLLTFFSLFDVETEEIAEISSSLEYKYKYNIMYYDLNPTMIGFS